MNQPSEPLDFSKMDVPNPSQKSLNPVVYEQGLGTEEALKRLLWRFNHIELNLEQRKVVLREGNIANLAGELFITLSIIQDLTDVCRELASLSYVSISQIRNGVLKLFQQEQGLISPPNPSANGIETPAQP